MEYIDNAKAIMDELRSQYQNISRDVDSVQNSIPSIIIDGQRVGIKIQKNKPVLEFGCQILDGTKLQQIINYIKPYFPNLKL